MKVKREGNMKRLDGFIDFNSLLGANLETLIKNGIVEDITNGLVISRYIIKIGEKNYFFKECDYEEAITELIVNEMLDYARIRNIKYDLACIDGIYGVISKDFKKEGYHYFNGDEILQEYKRGLRKQMSETEDKEFGEVLEEEYESMYYSTSNVLEVIWHALEYHFRDFENRDSLVLKIMRQLCITHIKDMLILNPDRNSTNWVIQENEKEADLVPDFDHGETFKDEKWSALHINPLGEEDVVDNTYKEFEKFIKWSDGSIDKVLVYLKSKLGMNNLDISIQKVEEKIGVPIHEDVKEEIRESFKKHQIKLDEILEDDNER